MNKRLLVSFLLFLIILPLAAVDDAKFTVTTSVQPVTKHGFTTLAHAEDLESYADIIGSTNIGNGSAGVDILFD
ncbi:MAG: hypothetical protein WC954_01385 [Sphaerochaeta sp.]